MANEEHLNILKHGVEVWNQWREKHPDEKIDLSGADLSGANLSGANLRNADLIGATLGKVNLFKAHLSEATLGKANLFKAHLIRANLSGANLNEAFLSEANLNEANLFKANLHNADLSGANLSYAFLHNADLIETDLHNANLIEADLRNANLFGANLGKANLDRADLRNAHLFGANLGKANLFKAHLIMADFRNANLSEAFLSGANLDGANLNHVNLGRVNLSKATITGAWLYNTARDDWIIDGIQCEYVYWDDKPFFCKDEKQKEEQWLKDHRFPKNKENFELGEFEELYKQFPTFDYVFEHGITLIDIAMINQIVNDIQTLHPDWELKIDSFHSRGQPHANFTIREKDLIAQAFQQIKTKYEETLNRLKGQYEESNRILATVVKEITEKPQLMITGDIVIGDKHIERDNIEISGQAQVNQLSTGDSGNNTSDSPE